MGDRAEREWEVYRLTLAAVREQVDRSWAQTQFFVLLNVGVLGAAFTVLGTAGPRAAAEAALLGGAALAFAGIFVLRENKRYYRRLVLKQTFLEEQLGLLTHIAGATHPFAIYALNPTADLEKSRRILADPRAYLEPSLRPGSVTDWARLALIVLAVLEIATALALVFRWI